MSVLLSFFNLKFDAKELIEENNANLCQSSYNYTKRLFSVKAYFLGFHAYRNITKFTKSPKLDSGS